MNALRTLIAPTAVFATLVALPWSTSRTSTLGASTVPGPACTTAASRLPCSSVSSTVP